RTMSNADPSPTRIAPVWRRYPIGVEISESGDVHARVWAPRRRTVDIELRETDRSPPRYVQLSQEPSGYFAGLVPEASAGMHYRFRLDGCDAFPDPASRAQPQGPHAPSQIIDPRSYRWRDTRWRGITIEGQVISEIHIGTFTEGGTFLAAAERLP